MSDRAQNPQSRRREQSYSSFLIRCWGLSDGRRRIKVQHVQSGQWTQVATFDLVMAWMDRWCAEAAEEERNDDD